jgi:glycine dehydrogenase subunit 1
LRYIPTTEQDRKDMLKSIGLQSIEGLFDDVPDRVRLQGELNLPSAQTEYELFKSLKSLAEKNNNLEQYPSFLGAGAYGHLIPSAVQHILSRSEFYTAYTPYQPEISQGVLQAIYEYQSLICSLTGMDVANASLYDGATALAEAAVLAGEATKRKKIFLPMTIHPEYRMVTQLYLENRGMEVIQIPHDKGQTDLNYLKDNINEEIAGVLIQQPNIFGILEEVKEVASLTQKFGALLVVSVNPISLGILEAPGHYGADIAVGEGQGLGNPVAFGGPFLGFFATRNRFIRQIPGRIVGATKDIEGKRGFVLTLQTREQHIRRQRASSNICSNQALNALAATVFLCLVGKKGLQEVANLCLQKAHYAYRKITSIKGYSPLFTQPFFHEFPIQTPDSPEVINKVLLEKGIIGGLDLKRHYPELGPSMLLCVTEARTKKEIDTLVQALENHHE